MGVQFLCQKNELNRERRGYFTALSKRQGVGSNNLDNNLTFNAINPSIYSTPIEDIDYVLFPDPPISILPSWIVQSPAPTICFQIDTYSKPEWRALWSSLFDYVVAFHPGYEGYFSKYGHERVLVFPHAVNAADYSRNAEERPFDVGWVGRIDGPLYESRRRVLPILKDRYKLNDWQRFYTEDETPQIYGLSRIVVNIGRDDYPQDANLRCFEAMAAGALLITHLPSELEQIGFQSGEHFIGYHELDELPALIDLFLRDSSRRKEIANKARELVLCKHSYDARVASLLSILDKDAGRKFAPARKWTDAQVNYVYLHYFCKRAKLKEAKAEFWKLLTRSPALALRGYPWLLRCWQHSKTTMQKIS
jgi:hypothetical protein